MTRKTPDTSIRLSESTVNLMRRAAGIRGMSLAEYGRVILEPFIDQDLVGEAEKITRANKAPRKPKD